MLPYSDDGFRDPGTPWMTWLLIAANTAIWLMTGLDPDYNQTVVRWGFIPADPSWSTAFTSMFMHGDLMHLAGNMWFLLIFGDNVELRMGPTKYLVAYLLAGLGGAGCHYVFFQNSPVPSIGASGAIYGVMGMYLFLFPYNHVKFFYFFFLFIGTFRLAAAWAIGFFFVKEALFGYFSARAEIQTGVGHLAHAGGFVVGLLVANALSAWGFVRNDGWNLMSWLRGRRPPELPADAPSGRPEMQARARVQSEPSKEQMLAALVNAERMDEARRIWRRESFDDHALILPPREQLELALALDKAGERSAAKDAYERLIEHYPEAQPFAAEAHLAVAGMLLEAARERGELEDSEVVAGHLRETIRTHPSGTRQALARRWLSAIDSA